jgi:hypothetical protein
MPITKLATFNSNNVRQKVDRILVDRGEETLAAAPVGMTARPILVL